MANFIDKYGRLDREKMVPGDRVVFYCDPDIYVFEMDEARELILDIEASQTPQELLVRVQSNRNLQDYLYDEYTEMSEMQIYLHEPGQELVKPRTACQLYAKAPYANIKNLGKEGEVYGTNEITMIKPDLPYESPDAAA